MIHKECFQGVVDCSKIGSTNFQVMVFILSTTVDGSQIILLVQQHMTLLTHGQTKLERELPCPADVCPDHYGNNSIDIVTLQNGFVLYHSRMV